MRGGDETINYQQSTYEIDHVEICAETNRRTWQNTHFDSLSFGVVACVSFWIVVLLVKLRQLTNLIIDSIQWPVVEVKATIWTTKHGNGDGNPNDGAIEQGSQAPRVASQKEHSAQHNGDHRRDDVWLCVFFVIDRFATSQKSFST